MGFKSLTNQKHLLINSNISNNYEIGGLIFDSSDDYFYLKNIDINIKSTSKLIEDGCFSLEDFFNKIKIINVRESYYDAREELYGLFKNSTDLLCYEDTRFVNDYEVGRCFFSKINIISYDDSYDDSDDYI